MCKSIFSTLSATLAPWRIVHCAILVAAYFSASALTSSVAAEAAKLSPDALFKRSKAAVVRIEVQLHGASLGVGSGFFVGRNGEIATSLHVVRPYLIHPETKILIGLSNGQSFRNVKIGACGDARGIDLCLLKVDATPKAVLPLGNTTVTPGESIVAIGHPRGLDFSISTGIVSALRTHPSGWREIQIDAAISPGNSGGPIINSNGQAVGIVYQFERDGQNLNFGIHGPEMQNLRAMARPFQSITEARKDFFSRSLQSAQNTIARSMAPALKSFSEPSKRPAGFRWMKAHFTDSSFLMLLPEIFPSCEKSEEISGSVSTSCSTNGGDIVITVQKRPRSLKKSMAFYHRRRLVEPRPLSLVERLESEGHWSSVAKNRSDFYSRPQTANCFDVTTLASDLKFRKNGFFENASAACRFDTENDSDAGAISTSQWIEIGKDFYGINVWSADPGRLPLLKSLSELIVFSAGTTGDERAAPYSRPMLQNGSDKTRKLRFD